MAIIFRADPLRGKGTLDAVVIDASEFTSVRHIIKEGTDEAGQKPEDANNVINNWRSFRHEFVFYDTMKFERNDEYSETNPYSIRASRYSENNWEFIEATETTPLYEDCLYIFMAVSLDANGHINNCGFLYSAKVGDDILWYITPSFITPEIITKLNNSISLGVEDVITCGTNLGNDFVFTGLNEDVTYKVSIGDGDTVTAHYPVSTWNRTYGALRHQISATSCNGIAGTKPDDEFPRGLEITASHEDYGSADGFAEFLKTQIPVLGTELIEYLGLIPGEEKTLILNSGYQLKLDLNSTGDRLKFEVKDSAGNYVTLKNYHGGDVRTMTSSWSFNDTNGYIDKLYLAKYPYNTSIENSQLFLMVIGRCGNVSGSSEYAGNWVFARMFGNGANGKPNDLYHNGLLSTSFLEDLLTDENGNSIVEEKPDPRVDPVIGPEFPGADDTADKYNDPETGTPGNNGSYQDAIISDNLSTPRPNENENSVSVGTDSFFRPYKINSESVTNLAKEMGNAVNGRRVSLGKIFENYFDSKPLDFILSLHQIPGNPRPIRFDGGGDPRIDHLSIAGECIDGFHPDTKPNPEFPVTGVMLADNYVINCGHADIYNRWGTATDFESTAEIWLPFIGYKTIDLAQIIPVNPQAAYTRVHLKYIVETATGACSAILEMTLGDNNVILNQWFGNCKKEWTLSQNSYDRVISGLSGVVSGAVNTGISAATGNPLQLIGGVSKMITSGLDAAKGWNAPEVQHTSAAPASFGWLSARYPYITIKRKVQALPRDYAGFYGFPAHIQSNVGKCQGFSQFSAVHVENINATDTEKREIEELLMKGVFI